MFWTEFDNKYIKKEKEIIKHQGKEREMNLNQVNLGYGNQTQSNQTQSNPIMCYATHRLYFQEVCISPSQMYQQPLITRTHVALQDSLASPKIAPSQF